MNQLKDAKFFIIAVPTPIKTDKTPNLIQLKMQLKLLVEFIKK